MNASYICWFWIQVYYDNSHDPPVPWWYNESTGESTWDCPTEEQLDDTTAPTALILGEDDVL